MNEITPYEQLIAAKLDQVPVPDMADSIWSSIEMHLDTDNDRPDAPAQKPAFAIKGLGWYGVAGIVAVIVLLWWYFGHKGPTDTTPSNPLPEKHAPSPAGSPPMKDSPASGKPVKKRAIPSMPVETKKDTGSLRYLPIDTAWLEPAANPVLPALQPDTASSHPDRSALPDADLYRPPQPAPHGKKTRGVKGIGDDDYKLTATKDSAKRKH